MASNVTDVTAGRHGSGLYLNRDWLQAISSDSAFQSMDALPDRVYMDMYGMENHLSQGRRVPDGRGTSFGYTCQSCNSLPVTLRVETTGSVPSSQTPWLATAVVDFTFCLVARRHAVHQIARSRRPLRHYVYRSVGYKHPSPSEHWTITRPYSCGCVRTTRSHRHFTKLPDIRRHLTM
jgi:hypothetical protein